MVRTCHGSFNAQKEAMALLLPLYKLAFSWSQCLFIQNPRGGLGGEAMMQPPSELICLGLLSTSLWKAADVGIIMMSRWVQCRAWPGGGSCSPLEPRRINTRLDSNQLCACKWSRLIMTSVDLKENTLNQPNKNTGWRHPLTAARLCQTPIYLSHKE